MYKYRSKQISLTDFNTPVGMKLNPDNRWVKKAELIPWDEIEQRYAKLFTNRKGNVAKPHWKERLVTVLLCPYYCWTYEKSVRFFWRKF